MNITKTIILAALVFLASCAKHRSEPEPQIVALPEGIWETPDGEWKLYIGIEGDEASVFAEGPGEPQAWQGAAAWDGESRVLTIDLLSNGWGLHQLTYSPEMELLAGGIWVFVQVSTW